MKNARKLREFHSIDRGGGANVPILRPIGNIARLCSPLPRGPVRASPRGRGESKRKEKDL